MNIIFVFVLCHIGTDSSRSTMKYQLQLLILSCFAWRADWMRLLYMITDFILSLMPYRHRKGLPYIWMTTNLSP